MHRKFERKAYSVATIQKRKNSWRAQVRRQGKAVSATFDTKAEAETWAIKTESKILEGASPSSIVNARMPQGESAADILVRYADEVSPKKRGGRWERVRLRGMARRYHAFDKPITAISGPDIAEWRDTRLLSVSASTVNRELSLISTVFTHAMKEWRLGLTSNPCAFVTKPRKARPRTQRISVVEREQIIDQLGWDGKSEPKTSGQWVAWPAPSGWSTG